MKVAMALLRHLHAWGANYQEPAVPLTEKDVLQQPEPSSSAQGVLLLLSCLTKRHSIALKVTLRSTRQLMQAQTTHRYLQLWLVLSNPIPIACLLSSH